jgi:hypothetical protein
LAAVKPQTARELEKDGAAIFMEFGQGADALRELGVTQEQFWRFVKRVTARRLKKKEKS